MASDFPTQVQPGDWVRFKGRTRIYEVFRVHEGQHRVYVEVIGMAMQQPVEDIKEIAAKFWIKRAGE